MLETSYLTNIYIKNEGKNYQREWRKFNCSKLFKKRTMQGLLFQVDNLCVWEMMKNQEKTFIIWVKL